MQTENNMDRDTLLGSLQGTLDASQQVRKQSEQQLHAFEEQAGFTAYLLDLIVDNSVPFGVQISAAIFFKNRIVNYWVLPENKAASKLFIQNEEKNLIKQKLIETLIKTYSNSKLKLSLSTALHNILSFEKWDELVPITKKLLSDTSNIDHVYTGLVCAYEYTKNYRWHGLDTSSGNSNPVLDDVAENLFPILESLTENLLKSDDSIPDEMLYLIVKIFKFTTYSALPKYLSNDPSKLGVWCHLQLIIINKPLPQSALDEEPHSRASHPRIKTVKWCFGNLHRLLNRHGGGFSTQNKDTNQFSHTFLSNFVPEILNAYWGIIESWSSKKIWLSEGSLYHLISFLEQLIESHAWSLIEDKLDAILKHVILPTLNANEETVELYEDETEEYVRRYLDMSRDANTSDIASINFVYRLSSKKFDSSINLVLSIVNDVFTRRNSNRSDPQTAMEVEGAFRVLSTISYKLDKSSSPVLGRVDQLLYSCVYPELSEDTLTKFPYLTARACDTLAMFNTKYSDEQILQQIFQAVVQCFQQDVQFPVKLTAIDAIRTLVNEDLVADHVAEQAPQLMETLLDMSKKIESDMLSSVMDSFVQKFAKNLEPYANQLSSRLAEQFLGLATELLNASSNDASSIDTTKEYQAAGILNTLVELVIATNSSPDVSTSIQSTLKPLVLFVLENSMISFITEALEILESLVSATQQMSPVLWELYQSAIDSFDTYAFEYFDIFVPFFEGVIIYGFKTDNVTIDTPHVQSLFKVCFSIVNNEDLEPVFAHSAFELIELSILSMNSRFASFLPTFLPNIFDTFQNLESIEAFDGHMLHHLSILRILFACLYIDPTTTIQFLNEKNFTNGFFKLWIQHSSDFQSVYGCKLQILASLAILCDINLNVFPQQDLIGEVTDLLMSNLEVLPLAIKARIELLAGETNPKVFDPEVDDDEYDAALYDDDFEADEAEMEALKRTPIDEINVFAVFCSKVSLMQQSDANRYQVCFGGLDDDQKELAQRIAEIDQQK